MIEGDDARWAEAFIPDAKVRDYLLSDAHDKARSRHKFFTAYGFSQAAWPQLQSALLEQLARAVRRLVREDAYGRTFAAVGPIRTPSSQTLIITTFWIVRHDDPCPQLTSALPGQH